MIRRLIVRGLGIALDVADLVLAAIEARAAEVDRRGPWRAAEPAEEREAWTGPRAAADPVEANVDNVNVTAGAATKPAEAHPGNSAEEPVEAAPTRICRGCAAPFTPPNGQTRFCSPECRRQALARRQREARARASAAVPGAPWTEPGPDVAPEAASAAGGPLVACSAEPGPVVAPEASAAGGALVAPRRANGGGPTCSYCFASVAEGAEFCGPECQRGQARVMPRGPAELLA